MENIAEKSERVRVVSLDTTVINIDDAMARMVEWSRAHESRYVCFSTVHMVMESHDDPEFGAKVNAADMVVTDGMPLVWMQRRQERNDGGRVRANDLMTRLCEIAARENIKVGFYGGRQEVIDRILERAKKELPGLQIAYAFSPPFRPLTAEEDAQITGEIQNSGTQILFMGLGCPKQENWMAAHRGRVPAVMLGVGASFDFYAGNVKESPQWLQNIGLEWLYRLAQEPRRLWYRYLVLNPRFMWQAAKQLSGRKKQS
ncbi:MAG TPA: WecB/TagA/CpsF family glycosyltransferase [Pyrinomonadaceae bacterium]|nr:WecB/TagA/CpsF family glycosyltransferase [Pyrinomonadaceae bacterium]